MLSSNIILTPERLQEQVDYFSGFGEFSFDVESWGPNRGIPTQNTLNWLSMATHGRAIAIPFGHPNGDKLISRATRRKNRETGKFDAVPAVYDEPPKQMRPSQVFEILKPLFFSDRTKIAHNATFDLISTAKYFGQVAPPNYSDTIVLQWLLNENLKQKDLKSLIKRYYKVDYDQEHVGRCVEAHPFSKVGHYAYMDAKYTWLLWKRLNPLIEKAGLDSVRLLEMDILGVLLDMGLEGAPVDLERLHELEADLSERLVDAEAKVYKSAGQRFNLNAPAQKASVLFKPKTEGGQGLRPWKLTKGGKKKKDVGQTLALSDYSTDAESLEKFANNPVVEAIGEYSDISKLLNTYVRGYLGVEGDKDKPSIVFEGRIHADFVQYGTVTGRFSCREPNLQNIPRPDTELGKKIRGLFIAPPGHKMIVADYGQIELVILAHFIGRGKLYEGFFNGVDPHTATAAGIFGQDPTELQKRVNAGDKEAKAWRQIAKAINFAVVYGAGPEKVAAMSKVSLKEAKRFLALHQEQFPEIYAFKERVIQTCRSRKFPYVRTLLGRKRRLPEIKSSQGGIRGKAERQAVNSLIQGSAADLIKLAMVRLNSTLPDDMRLILSVHDELVTIVPDDAERIALGEELVREAMLGKDIQKLVKVPLTSDSKTVSRWAEAK